VLATLDVASPRSGGSQPVRHSLWTNQAEICRCGDVGYSRFVHVGYVGCRIPKIERDRSLSDIAFGRIKQKICRCGDVGYSRSVSRRFGDVGYPRSVYVYAIDFALTQHNIICVSYNIRPEMRAPPHLPWSNTATGQTLSFSPCALGTANPISLTGIFIASFVRLGPKQIYGWLAGSSSCQTISIFSALQLMLSIPPCRLWFPFGSGL